MFTKFKRATIHSFASLIGKLARLIITELPDVHIYTRHFCRLCDNNGYLYALRYMKIARSAMYRYISGRPLKVSHPVRLTHDGIPVFLQDWIPFIRVHSPRHLQVVITLLSLGRIFTDVGVLDTTPITSPYTGKKVDQVIPQSMIADFLDSCNLRTRISFDLPESFIRTSMGPSGPAMSSVMHEAQVLPDSLVETISRLLPSNLSGYLNRCRSYPPKGGKHYRKIVVVPDKEGKSRIIAILDYWSQLALRTLHSLLIRVIKGLRSDCTFDQTGRISEFYHYNSRFKDNFHSLDLSSATDRMPAKLQENLLREMLGPVAHDYFHVLTGYPFTLPNGEIIQYEVGQPMGAYSSWPLMALTHHLIVFSAFRKAGVRFNHRRYMLIGDDIVISGDKVAESYRNICSDLGMEISEMKTLVSSDTFDFAKRLISRGENISPLPVGQLAHCVSTYWDIVGFIEQCGDRNWNLDSSKTWRVIANHFGTSRRHSDWLYRKIKFFYWMPNCFQAGWSDSIRFRLQKCFPVGSISCVTAHDELSRIYMDAFYRVTMKTIHDGIISSVKSFNKWAHKPAQREVMEGEDYNPLVELVHEYAHKVTKVEYSLLDDSASMEAHIKKFVEEKITLGDFVTLPTNLDEVSNQSRYSKHLKLRSTVADKVLNLFNEYQTQRSIELSSDT